MTTSRLLADIDAAAKMFRRYEVLHRAKGTADADAKAEANGKMAERLEATLAATRQPAASTPSLSEERLAELLAQCTEHPPVRLPYGWLEFARAIEAELAKPHRETALAATTQPPSERVTAKDWEQIARIALDARASGERISEIAKQCGIELKTHGEAPE